ncbi:MAG TPA: cupin domain-containing protein [Patescibacteria group bacterium]|nr:cupin domain-containing protein [Patescibacteria group bacterium]
MKLEGTQKYQRLFAGIPQTCGMRSGYVRLTPGESVGAHNTDAREEAIVILSGKAEIHTGESDVFSAEAGSVIYMPPHTPHDIKNIGQETLRYVYVVSPLTAATEKQET